MTLNGTLIQGLLVLTAASFVGLHQVLMGPGAVNYPRSPPLVRAGMFIWAGTLLFRGADLVIGWWRGEPQAVVWSQFLAAGMFVFAHGLLLGDMLLKRSTASLWARVDRSLKAAFCTSWWARLWLWFRGRPTLGEARQASQLAVRPEARTRQPKTITGSGAIGELKLQRPGTVAAPGETFGAFPDLTKPPPK